MGEEPTPEVTTPAEKVGRGAGLFAKFAIRQALKSKTVREQLRDVREEADRPADRE